MNLANVCLCVMRETFATVQSRNYTGEVAMCVILSVCVCVAVLRSVQSVLLGYRCDSNTS